MTANHQQSNKLFAKESKMRYFQCDYNHISEILLRASSRMDENYETTEKILEIRNLNVFVTQPILFGNFVFNSLPFGGNTPFIAVI